MFNNPSCELDLYLLYLFIFLFIDVLKYILYVHKNAFWMDGLITST